ncbi:C4-dicarboxylate transporter DctA, partial [Pseudarthrobacter sp. NPDC080039]
NAVATVLVGTWVKEIDGAQVTRVLSGELPFDEQTMIAGHGEMTPKEEGGRQVATA